MAASDHGQPAGSTLLRIDLHEKNFTNWHFPQTLLLDISLQQTTGVRVLLR